MLHLRRKNRVEPTSAIDSDPDLSSSRGATTQRMLLLRAYWKLIQVDRRLRKGEFAKLRTEVHACPVAQIPVEDHALDRVCRAIDTACIWYWKEVLCLQRSAATACLLKAAGIPAQMIIGVQQLPFLAHAWVEVEGRVVNDKSYMRELYMVLDVC